MLHHVRPLDAVAIANAECKTSQDSSGERARDIGRQGENREKQTRRGTVMTGHDLHSVALTLVAERKGILAADETVPTLAKRFDSLGIPSTEQSRRTYRQMLLTCPGAAEFVSSAITHDETIRQKSSDGTPLVELQMAQGIVPGIKVDTGAKPLAGSRQETVTERLDGLRDRLSEYRTMGVGKYADDMEAVWSGADDPPHRRDWRDD